MSNETIEAERNNPLTTKQKSKIFIETCLKLFLIFTLICYAVKIIFNVNWFIIIDKDINVPYIVGAIIYSFTFTLNILFIIMFVNNKYNKIKILLCGITIFVIVFIINYFFYSYLDDYYWILSYVFPILAGFIPIYKIKLRARIIRMVIANVISILLTFIFVNLKIRLFNFGYNDLNIITGVIYEIDLFIIYYFTLNFWHNMGGENNVCRKHLVLFRWFRGDVRKENGKEGKGIKKSFKYKFFIFKYQFLQLALILFSSCFILAGIRRMVYDADFIKELLNNFIIFVFIYFSFVAGRKAFGGKSWHSKTFWGCTAVSVISFYYLTAGAFPLSISLYMSIISGVLLSYVLSVMFEKNKKAESFENLFIEYEAIQKERKELQLEKKILELELKVEKEKHINEEKETLKKLYSLSVDELRIFLKSKLLTDKETDATIFRVNENYKLSWKEIGKKLGYSRSSIDETVRNVKLRLELNSKTRL